MWSRSIKDRSVKQTASIGALQRPSSLRSAQTVAKSVFNLFRLCQKDEISFDIVAETGNIVAKDGNNVEAMLVESCDL